MATYYGTGDIKYITKTKKKENVWGQSYTAGWDVYRIDPDTGAEIFVGYANRPGTDTARGKRKIRSLVDSDSGEYYMNIIKPRLEEEREKKELRGEYEKEIGDVKSEIKKGGAELRELAETRGARQTGLMARMLKQRIARDQSGGAGQEEAIISTMAESGVRNLQDITRGVQAQTRKYLAGAEGMDVQMVTDVESAGMQRRELSNLMQQFWADQETQRAQIQANLNMGGGGGLFDDMLGSLAKGAGTAAGAYAFDAALVKATAMCLPKGAKIDTPEGQVNIEDLNAGDKVIGYNGQPIDIMQKHEYKENPNLKRFLEISFNDGGSVNLCDMHRIKHIRSKDYRAGDYINGKEIINIKWYDGVKISYDLLTKDGGYRIAGASVDSMIPEMNALISTLSKEFAEEGV